DKSKLEQCGRQLTVEIRDEACKFLQQVLSGTMKDSTSKLFYEQYRTLDPDARAFVDKVVVAAVDSCFVRFLNFFDAHSTPLMVKNDQDEIVNIQALSDGLVGELYSDQGWLAKYSQFKDRIAPPSKV